MAETATEQPKRKSGRPKGHPRTGGRAPGTPNKKNQVTRDYVIKEGAPLAFLCSVVRGKRFTAAAEQGDGKRTHVFPTMDQRIRAAEVLSRKCLPDLKATELTGKDGEPLIEPTRRVELLGTMEAARLILAALREGVEAEAELDGIDAPTIDAEPVLIPSPEDAENAETLPATAAHPLCAAS